MNAAEAKRILGIEQMTKTQLYHNGAIRFIDAQERGVECEARMVGRFTADDLKAIAYWLEHREEFGNGDTTDSAVASIDTVDPMAEPWDDDHYGPAARADAARDAGG